MTDSLFENKAVKEVLDYYKTIWALNHHSALADWDFLTYMPEEGAEFRGEASAKLSSLRQKLFLDKEFGRMVAYAEKQETLNDHEKGVLRILRRKLDDYQKLPSEFLEECEKVYSMADLAWKNARKDNNFPLFAPHLEKIVALAKRKTEYLGYKDHPYDALLDQYEDGLTTRDVERFFSSIKGPLSEIFARVRKSPRYGTERKITLEGVSEEDMNKFDKKVLEVLQYNPKRMRIDLSAHPFSCTVSGKDGRITTRHKGENFVGSVSSIIHEFGHGLYGQQGLEALEFTPIGTSGDLSLIVHESQSRFWENIVGRSREFLKLIYADAVKLKPEIEAEGLEGLYRSFNPVKPGFIRVDADELTYHFHVMVRFELEKALIEGKLEVKDLPRAWNNKYKEYLGIEPKTDSEGVLQDVHWSGGNIGYFPTYSMGTFLSGMMKSEMEKDLGSVYENAKSPEGIKKMQSWLQEKVHRHGATYPTKDLVQKAFGKEFTPEPFLAYLRDKYEDLYPSE